MLTDLPLPPEVVSLLGTLEGLVIDYALFKCYLPEAELGPPVEVLRMAARRTIERAREARRGGAPTPMNGWEAWYAVDEAKLEAATPMEISWDEFLGPWWDAKARRLLGMNEASPPRPRPGSAEPEWNENGYAHAFAHPPYALRIHGEAPAFSPHGPGATADKAFLRINKLLLGADLFDRRVRIWRWPTDWSKYFEPGREWWGSYCWTLWAGTGEHKVVGIAASSTD